MLNNKSCGGFASWLLTFACRSIGRDARHFDKHLDGLTSFSFYYLLSFSALFFVMGELFGIRRSRKDRGGAAALAGTNKLLHKSLFNFHFLVPPAALPSCYGPQEVVTAALWVRWNNHVFQSVWENTQGRLSGCGSGSLFALISPFTMI